MSRLNSLFYKIILTIIVLSLLPAAITGLRLLTLNEKILQQAANQYTIPVTVTNQINQTLNHEFTAYLAYTLLGVLILAIFVSGQLNGSLLRLLEWVNTWLAAEAGRSHPTEQQITEAQHTLVQQKDESGLLASAIAQMGSELLHLEQKLKSQEQARYQAVGQRARQLQAAAEVGRAAATIRDLDELLTQSVRLISQRFGYDHAGIFLLDDNGQYAVLRAASSEGGLQMLVRGHRLNVIGAAGDTPAASAATSIVGYVAATLQPRIALDVGVDSVHFKNPYLPKTRSEMALPLIVGSIETAADSPASGITSDAAGASQPIRPGRLPRRLLGVLDIQSNQPNAFVQEDIETLQILADQIAIAIENAYLFIENQNVLAEMRAALESSRRAYGEISLEAWRKLLQRRPDFGYSCAVDNIPVPVNLDWSAEMQVAVTRPEASDLQTVHIDSDTLVIPIKIRDQLAGLIKLRKPIGEGSQPTQPVQSAYQSHWTNNEISLMETLSDQLSVALESARLYEETQRRAERERLAGEITAKLRASNQPEAILQTAVKELRRALQASKAQVLIHTSHPDGEDSAKQPGASQRAPAQGEADE